MNIHSPNENLGSMCIGLGFFVVAEGFIEGINGVTRYTFKRVFIMVWITR